MLSIVAKLLLDTHLILWWIDGHPYLPEAVVSRVLSKNVEAFVSQISLLEMAIKVRLGKLNLPVPLEEIDREIVRRGFHWLQLQNSHLLALAELEICKNHKDPFDQLLIAQSRMESMELITSDKTLEFYGAKFYPRSSR
ncbi:MAG: type II toxin-antitoxin system VapC family toxin [Cyanobacteria bacterium MAG CAR2_bin_4]|nr:type II toxin-antitoxin system VapC family toxin [Cyanobacteria bacterium MAG CAR2_bin_4]